MPEPITYVQSYQVLEYNGTNAEQFREWYNPVAVILSEDENGLIMDNGMDGPQTFPVGSTWTGSERVNVPLSDLINPS